MPIDEEQSEVALEIGNEAKKMLQGKLVSSGVAGVLSLVPGVGAAITELMTELAIQRTNDRMKSMFEHFTSRIREVGEDNVDREWFRSEEFQSLLYDAIQQLHVTHDRAKIEMLGVALANSGAPGFNEEERKDLFVHFVRELTPQHLKVLVVFLPNPLPFDPNSANSPSTPPLDPKATQKIRWFTRPTVIPKDDDLVAIQMLHAYGLLEEDLKVSIDQPGISGRFTTESQIRDLWKRVSKSIEHPAVTRSFRLSPLGDDFLKFVGLPRSSNDRVNGVGGQAS